MTSAARRVRRLRWRLTALFTLTSAVGLLVLAGYAAHADAGTRHTRVDGELNVQTSQAIPQVDYDEKGHVDPTDMLDTVDADCPALTVMNVDAGKPVIAWRPAKPCVRVRDADLLALAAVALRRDDLAFGDGRASDGRPLRLLAAPFVKGGTETTDAVMVSAVDVSGDQAAQRRLELTLGAGCLLLVLLSAAVGHLLSGRATRPMLEALRQQENFLADAAHDLRTPTASLRSLAETALRDGEGRTTALQRTVDLAARMGDLIDGLLVRARLEAGVAAVRAEPLRFDQLVETVVTDATDADIEVHTEPVVVNADPELLRRAVANLIDNAVVHGRIPDSPARVVATVTADGTLTVDDAGPGIPPESAERLFERFRSGSGSSGLGLSIASWAVHALGGELTVETSPIGGARFVLRLPVHRA